MPFAGYLAYGAGLQMAGSLAVAFAVAGAVGLLFDKLAHLPLVKQGALPAAIASIATGLVLENIVRLGFGNEPRGFDRPIARDPAAPVGRGHHRPRLCHRGALFPGLSRG